MFRRSTLLLTVAAGASAVALSAAPAIAAPTYTVKAGTQTTGTTAYTAATTGASPQVAFSDTTSGLNVSCTSSTAKGAIKLGKSLAGAGLGSITSSTWTGCLGPLNLAMTVTQTATWNVNATGTTTTTGVTAGTISGIAATVTANQGGCSFNVAGTVKSALTTTPTKQTLAVKPTATLAISNVVGCFGQINNGDKASIKATYKITAAAGKIAISNP